MSIQRTVVAICAVTIGIIASVGCSHSGVQTSDPPPAQATGAMQPRANAPGPQITPNMTPQQQQAAADQMARAQQFQQMMKERASQPQPK